MNVGFTGTKAGMTNKQKAELERQLSYIFNQKPEQYFFHHGDCVGADVQAAAIAKKIGYKIVGYPGFSPKFPRLTGFRGFFPSDVTHPAEPFLDRNHKIVDAADIMFATPEQPEEVLRSGTWATIRYAKKSGKKVVILQP